MAGFNDIIAADRPVLVDFFADWCGPCKTMAPILKQVKDAVGEKATIIKVDVDHNPGVSQHFGIQGVPTLILFRSGKVLWRQSGVVAAQELLQVLKRHGA